MNDNGKRPDPAAVAATSPTPLSKSPIQLRELNEVEEQMLAKRFTYHPPKVGQPQLYEDLRARGLALARRVAMTSPPCREQSLAITKLEEAIMWANAAIARNS
jgi:hypothetical protein